MGRRQASLEGEEVENGGPLKRQAVRRERGGGVPAWGEKGGGSPPRRQAVCERRWSA